MLFVRELHRVIGASQDAFEAAYRDGYMPLVAQDPGTRLLWFLNLAHGSGFSYNVVTVTGVADWAAWERLALRMKDGDLAGWSHPVDSMRYGSTASVVIPTSWSPLPMVDLAKVPTDGTVQHELTMFAEETIVPDRGTVAAGVEAVGRLEKAKGAGAGNGLSELTAAFQTSYGTGPRRSVILLQRILDVDRLADYYLEGGAVESPPWSAGHDAPPFTDTWETRLLRAAPWSPLY